MAKKRVHLGSKNFFTLVVLSVAVLGTMVFTFASQQKTSTQSQAYTNVFNWPASKQCVSDGQTDKQAMKLWNGTNFSLDKEIECGNAAYAKNNTQSVNDPLFGSTNEYGAIEKFDNKLSSFILYNRSNNDGACFIFYEYDWYKGEKISYYVPAKGNAPVKHIAVYDYSIIGSFGNRASSVEVRAPYSKQQCLTLSDYNAGGTELWIPKD